MADFSKQFCERNDMGFPGDFDILEEFKILNESTYVSMICEGYGFVAIGKIEGKCVLAIPDYEEDTIVWASYEDIVGEEVKVFSISQLVNGEIDKQTIIDSAPRFGDEEAK